MSQTPPVTVEIADLPDETPHDAISEESSPFTRVVTLLAVVIPFLGLVAAVVLLWGWGVSWIELVSLAVMYCLTVLGVTVGYHRLFTHKSFETRRPVQFVLAVLGSMSVEGPVLKWVAVHRRHHQHSDSDEDPHSPHAHGHGLVGLLKGIWHAHVGWLFHEDAPNLSRYVPDLMRDRVLRQVNALFPLWVVIGLLVPAIACGLVAGSWKNVVLGLLWGGLVRVFLVHHVTWSINSVCHLWGSRPFRTHDHSRNNLVFGVLAFGEGWHNNHHAFPASARHGLKWWQIDFSYWVIRALAAVKLAWAVRVPSQQILDQKKQTTPPPSDEGARQSS